MENSLHTLNIHQFVTQSGKPCDIPLSYQLFGRDLHTAPIVMINHALTGNSDVAGENGWWTAVVGPGKPVDTDLFTVICFNIPGNGFDGFFIDDYKAFTAEDIATLFLKGLEHLHITQLYALVGGSVGGSIGWQMLIQQPALAQVFVPIATDFKTSDWLHSQCLVQKFLLESQDQPLEKARLHAMLCYRTPESLNFRFQNQMDAEKKIRKSEDWLNYHGQKLTERFSLKAYKLVNHLLMNIKGAEENLTKIQAEMHLIAIDTDLFYPAFEIKNTWAFLQQNKKNAIYHEIKSVHGHDAFLMEYEQLNSILKPIIQHPKNEAISVKNNG